MKINLNFAKGCRTTEYAAQELKMFLNLYTAAVVTCNENEADANICLCTDDTLKPHCYTLCGDGANLKIAGGNASSVLCGVYAALTEAGVLFEATGYSLPASFDMNALFNVKKEFDPKFKLRGIRQHINFPMDVSIYTLKDAKEYFRNLARMQYNAITFHSYPGQWHETEPDNPESLAGHLYYGLDYPLADADPLTRSRVNNKTVLSIPEMEEVYFNEAARGEYAKYWLNQVMDCVKECGMELTLSVEPVFDDMEKMGRMLHEVCKTYPLIDTLELLSFEGGADNRIWDLSMDTVDRNMAALFGDDILDENGEVEGKGTTFSFKQLGGGAISLDRILRAIDCRDTWLAGLEKKPALRAGLYLTCADTLKILWPIMRKKVPADVTRSILPAHGALAVANNVEKIGFGEFDWGNTMVYSWAEFDGNMYLQQMSTDGLEKMTQMPCVDNAYGLCINHWRLSENKVAIAYGAKTSVTPVTTKAYYQEYAETIGIGNADLFVEACDRMAILDSFNRDYLFNVGFCSLEVWVKENGYEPPIGWDTEKMEHAIAEYRWLEEAFTAMLDTAKSKEAIAFIRLMINRCKASWVHLHTQVKLEEIKQIYDYKEGKEPTAEQRAAINAALTSAYAYAQEYLDLYGENIADRSVEGHLLSYGAVIPPFIRFVESHFDPSIEISVPFSYDAPPIPDYMVK
ncbi:MAG: hypothetical protein IKC46_03420 [Lachnospiraceae bacterium]|nr:hypothetical protein [Lachnospiraceae bacterium]